MKKITFDKKRSVKVGGGYRKVTGYLLEQSFHPGRQFAVAMSLRANGEPRGLWRLYRCSDGAAMCSGKDFQTRTECVEYALEYLARITPATMQEIEEATAIKWMTQELQAEPCHA